MASSVSFRNIGKLWSYQAAYWEIPFAWAFDKHLDSNVAPEITKELEICLLSYRAHLSGRADPGHALQYFIFNELPLREQRHLLEAMKKTLSDMRNGGPHHPFWQLANYDLKDEFVDGTAEMVDYMKRSYAKSLQDARSS